MSSPYPLVIPNLEAKSSILKTPEDIQNHGITPQSLALAYLYIINRILTIVSSVRFRLRDWPFCLFIAVTPPESLLTWYRLFHSQFNEMVTAKCDSSHYKYTLTGFITQDWQFLSSDAALSCVPLFYCVAVEINKNFQRSSICQFTRSLRPLVTK